MKDPKVEKPKQTYHVSADVMHWAVKEFVIEDEIDARSPAAAKRMLRKKFLEGEFEETLTELLDQQEEREDSGFYFTEDQPKIRAELKDPVPNGHMPATHEEETHEENTDEESPTEEELQEIEALESEEEDNEDYRQELSAQGQ